MLCWVIQSMMPVGRTSSRTGSNSDSSRPCSAENEHGKGTAPPERTLNTGSDSFMTSIKPCKTTPARFLLTAWIWYYICKVAYTIYIYFNKKDTGLYQSQCLAHDDYYAPIIYSNTISHLIMTMKITADILPTFQKKPADGREAGAFICFPRKAYFMRTSRSST